MKRVTETEVLVPFDASYLSWKLGWSEPFSAGAIREYRRFMVMALNSKREVTPSQCVDEVWHYHILHTQEYAALAEKLGRFLHHNPGGPGTEDRARFNEQYRATKQIYVETFDEYPPVEFWPSVEEPVDALSQVLAKLAA